MLAEGITWMHVLIYAAFMLWALVYCGDVQKKWEKKHGK